MGFIFPSSFAEEIFRTKYAFHPEESPETFFRRLAKLVSLGDSRDEAMFYSLMTSFRFVPGGRILAFGGRPDAKVSLMNCTTHAVEGDSLEDIAHTAYVIMRASSRGQGIGIDLSALRPRGAPVNNAAKTSTGAISFMEMLNAIGGTIGQNGRRAALLFSLRVDHPDTWRLGEHDEPCPKCHGSGCLNCGGSGFIPYDFLHVKTIPGRVENANISVFITDDFMRAVKEDRDWEMRFSGDGFVVHRVVKARALMRELARQAHASAEPGVLFIDTIRRYSNSDLFGYPVVGTNACSEEPLDQDGVCALGSVNLSAYVKNPFTSWVYFDFDQFKTDVYYITRFMDNVLSLELNRGFHSVENQRYSVENLRRIGIGVMGLHDMLVKMRLRYRADERTLSVIRNVLSALRDNAYFASVSLARERGAMPVWKRIAQEDPKRIQEIVESGFYATLPDELKRAILWHGIRNVTLLSIAPTGSISNLAGTSSGIEPIFDVEFVRRTRMRGKDEFVTYVHPLVSQTRTLGYADSAVWDTAREISPDDHVVIQAEAQRYIDASISKTTNLPASARIEDVERIYMKAWELGLKGITVYRDGSRSQAVLYENGGDACPVCNQPLVREDGCVHCPSCGYGRCE